MLHFQPSKKKNKERNQKANQHPDWLRRISASSSGGGVYRGLDDTEEPSGRAAVLTVRPSRLPQLQCRGVWPLAGCWGGAVTQGVGEAARSQRFCNITSSEAVNNCRTLEYRGAEVHLLNLPYGGSIFLLLSQHLGWAVAALQPFQGLRVLPAAAGNSSQARRCERRARRMGSPDFYGVLGTSREQAAAST